MLSSKRPGTPELIGALGKRPRPISPEPMQKGVFERSFETIDSAQYRSWNLAFHNDGDPYLDLHNILRYFDWSDGLQLKRVLKGWRRLIQRITGLRYFTAGMRQFLRNAMSSAQYARIGRRILHEDD